MTTGLHPSTAHRILNDMVVGRFVDRADTPGSYRLGMRLLELGNLVKARLSVREAALEPMRDLHRKTGQTVNLSVRQGDEIVYIDRSYSERSGMQVVRAIGGRAPLHLTSSGKLFLAYDDPRARPRLRDAHRAGRTHEEQHHGPARSSSANCRWFAHAGTHATTRNWNWESAASPRASGMTRGCIAGLVGIGSVRADAGRLDRRAAGDRAAYLGRARTTRQQPD